MTQRGGNKYSQRGGKSSFYNRRSKNENRNTDTIALSEEDKERMRLRALRFSGNNQTKGAKHYGLVSRGEDNTLQLNRHNEREDFFSLIKQEFLLYCSTHDDLRGEFQILASTQIARKPEQGKLDEILLNLRKLREALLNTKPTEFTIKVYLYSVRVSSRIGHHQTYVPCIRYLIGNVVENQQVKALLSESDLDEIVSIYILHQAHFKLGLTAEGALSNSAEISNCFDLWHKYNPYHFAIGKILRAVVSNNYLQWFQIYSNELRTNLSYRAVLERYGLPKMMKNLVLVLSICYFKLAKPYLEETLMSGAASYEQLVSHSPELCRNWRLEDSGKLIIIRDRKKS